MGSHHRDICKRCLALRGKRVMSCDVRPHYSCALHVREYLPVLTALGRHPDGHDAKVRLRRERDDGATRWGDV